MIYISSACVKANKISDSVLMLAKNGFNHIELSGGTNYFEGFERDLTDLRSDYNLMYLMHNYFPPLKKHFVLNLASLSKKIFNKTLDHFKRAIDLAAQLRVEKYGIHAGFLIDPMVSELGENIYANKINIRKKAIDIFCKGYDILKNYSNQVKIYIENNVLSFANYKKFKTNPFLLTSYESYLELKTYIDFNFLLDIAHLKVSCRTLGLNFSKELRKSLVLTDYIHISDNNGLADTNRSILVGSKIYYELNEINLRDKTITLEIYDGMEKITGSYKIINDLIKNG